MDALDPPVPLSPRRPRLSLPPGMCRGRASTYLLPHQGPAPQRRQPWHQQVPALPQETSARGTGGGPASRAQAQDNENENEEEKQMVAVTKYVLRDQRMGRWGVCRRMCLCAAGDDGAQVGRNFN